MNAHDPHFDDGDIASDAVAPDDVQRDVAALLRRSAQRETETVRMPAGVEAGLLETLRAEGWTGSTPAASSAPPRQDEASSSATPRTVVPLPVVRARAPQTQASAPTSGPAAPSAPVESETVTSLDAHRERRRSSSRGRMVLGLGAAAAVVVGTIGFWAQHGSGSASKDAPLAASQFRVTGSQKSYSTASFDKQTATMVDAPYPELSQSDVRKFGVQAVPTKEQLTACVTSLRGFLTGKIDKVYADFGTYEGKDSLIVVAVQGSTKKAWALNRTALQNSCGTKADIQYGPRSITA